MTDAEDDDEGDPSGIVKGRRTLSNCNACNSGLAFPIAVTAARVWRSVERGGNAAASTTRTNVAEIQATSFILRRSGKSGTGIVDVFVSSTESDFVSELEEERVSDFAEVNDSDFVVD